MSAANQLPTIMTVAYRGGGTGAAWPREAGVQTENARRSAEEAKRQETVANQQRDKALRSQVVQLGAAAESQIDAGDAVTGMLLALEAVHALPGSASRGFTAEAERALIHAMQEQRGADRLPALGIPQPHTLVPTLAPPWTSKRHWKT